MKCDDVRTRLPELALGDLDIEPARAVEEHLKDCPSCREERGALARAAEALRGAAPLAPSTERREAAVAAMGRAQAEEAEALLTRPRRRWIAWTAAAAAAAAVAVLALRPAAPSYTAVSGTAFVFRSTRGDWSALRPGDRLAPGDRLRGEARLAVPGGSILLEAETWVAVLRDGRLSLDQGRLRAELGEGARRPVVVADTGNNTVTLRRGVVEVGLREVKASVLPFVEEKGGPRSAAEPARTVAALRLTVSVADGEADLDGSHRQRLRLHAGQNGTFSIDGQPSLLGREIR